jgi:carboxylesterase
MTVLAVVIFAFVVLFLVLGYLIDFRFDLSRPEVSPLQGRRNYLRGCGPFEVGTGDRALMFLHGIAGSPAQVKEVAERLAAEGFHVYGVVLPGHGTDPEDLFGITWQRWYEHVVAEHGRIREKHGEVSVAGFSLGGALGMRLAMDHPVEKLICISVSSSRLFHDYLPSHWLLRGMSFLSNTARTFPKRLPETEDGPEYLIYNKIAMDALNTLVDLVHENEPRLGDVNVPTLIIHSKKDVASRPKGAQQLFDGLGTEEKRLVWFETAPHGLMHGSDTDKTILHHEIVDFLAN